MRGKCRTVYLLLLLFLFLLFFLFKKKNLVVVDVFIGFLVHCLSPVKVGPCRGAFPRWHFNAASGVCELFTFGGCKPNGNNYVSQQECSDACNGTTGTK